MKNVFGRLFCAFVKKYCAFAKIFEKYFANSMKRFFALFGVHFIKHFSRLGRLCLCAFMGVLLSSCGYVPSASFAQKALGDSVFVKLNINLPNPENSVELKDEFNKIIISRFQNKIANADESDSIITIDIDKITDTHIAVSSDAFATYYRVSVFTTYTYDDKKGNKRSVSGSGYFDYNISLDNPLTTHNNRYYAINQAFLQTIDRFVAMMAYEGQYR